MATTTSIKSSRSASDVKKSNQAGVAKAQRASFECLQNEKLLFEGYDFDKKTFIFKIKRTGKTIEVNSWYLKPVKHLPEGRKALEITEEECRQINYESFEGLLKDIDGNNPDIFTIDCADGGIVEVASIDASIYNKLQNKEFKLRIKEETNLMWSSKKDRCFYLPTFILVVE